MAGLIVGLAPVLAQAHSTRSADLAAPSPASPARQPRLALAQVHFARSASKQCLPALGRPRAHAPPPGPTDEWIRSMRRPSSKTPLAHCRRASGNAWSGCVCRPPHRLAAGTRQQ